MTLQWTVIAAIMYAESAFILLLLLPIVSSKRWEQIFSSRFFNSIKSYMYFYFTIFLGLVAICLFDAVREMRKYGTNDKGTVANPLAADHNNMRLFRAQRNFYIAGFTVFLWFVLRRLVILISNEAVLNAKYEAAIQNAVASAPTNTEAPAIENLLKAKEEELAALRSQVEASNNEYDRLSKLYQELQNDYNAQVKMENVDKKSD